MIHERNLAQGGNQVGAASTSGSQAQESLSDRGTITTCDTEAICIRGYD